MDVQKRRSKLIARIACFKTLDEVFAMANVLFQRGRPMVILELGDLVDCYKDALKVFHAHKFLLKRMLEDERPIELLLALMKQASVSAKQSGEIFSNIAAIVVSFVIFKPGKKMLSCWDLCSSGSLPS